VSDKLVLRIPLFQRLVLPVWLGAIAVILGVFASTASPGFGLGLLGPMAAVLVFMSARIVRTRWEVTFDGLAVEGYLWRWVFPRKSIASVAVMTLRNSVRVRDARGAGRSLPLGTSQPTRRSLAKGRKIAAQLADVWDVPWSESDVSGFDDPTLLTRTSPSETRSLVRAPGAWVMSGAVFFIVAFVQGVRAFS
jgi:hypothetical protein